MRALLIDPENKTVTEVDFGGGLPELYRLTRCDIVEVAPHNVIGHVLYVDEEGLYKRGARVFEIDGAHQPYVGCGLMVGYDGRTGTDKGATISLETLRGIVRFPDLAVA